MQNYGGSFWSFYQTTESTAEFNNLDELLENPAIALEEILLHKSTIQECKYSNASLITFLTTKENLRKLIEYIITIPSEEEIAKLKLEIEREKAETNGTSNENGVSNGATATSSTKSDDPTEPGTEEEHGEQQTSNDDSNSTPATTNSTFKLSAQDRETLPYVASEIFACEIGPLLDTLFEHEELLDYFFTFLDNPVPIDPSCTAYFRKVMVVLIQQKHLQLITYIQAHQIIDRLLNHIGLYSMMEILIMIGWDDGKGSMNDTEWLYKENLIPKLADKLSYEYDSQPDVHMNAARALVDAVVKCPCSSPNLLISHLQSTPILQKIFANMFNRSSTSLTNSMSIIIVLVQRYANRQFELMQGNNEDASEETSTNSNVKDAELNSELESYEEPFVSLLPHLPSIFALLDTRLPNVEIQFGEIEPFGEMRMKVIELFLVLLRSHVSFITEKLIELKVFEVTINCLFAYPWNNMLHGLVESIIRTILETPNPTEDNLHIKKALFKQTNFISRSIAAFHSPNVIVQKGDKVVEYRVGYLGHLHRICVTLEDYFCKNENDRLILCENEEGVEQWNKFFSSQLEPELEKHKLFNDVVAAAEGGLNSLSYEMSSMDLMGRKAGYGADYGTDGFNFDNEEDSSLGYDYPVENADFTMNSMMIPNPDGDESENLHFTDSFSASFTDNFDNFNGWATASSSLDDFASNEPTVFATSFGPSDADNEFDADPFDSSDPFNSHATQNSNRNNNASTTPEITTPPTEPAFEASFDDFEAEF